MSTNTIEQQEIIELVEALAHGSIGDWKSAKEATILWALAHTQGDVAMAADLLGTSRSTVYRCARRHGTVTIP